MSITVGQTDTFESGTDNWEGGGQHLPDGPSVTTVTSGGPYLHLQTLQSHPERPLGKPPRQPPPKPPTPYTPNLSTHNKDQWSGNYHSAGVTGVRFRMKNLGEPGELKMRLVLISKNEKGKKTYFNSTQVVTPGAEWTDYTFALNSGGFKPFHGEETFYEVFRNVEKLLIRHQPELQKLHGKTGGIAVVGSLGIFSVTALP